MIHFWANITVSLLNQMNFYFLQNDETKFGNYTGGTQSFINITEFTFDVHNLDENKDLFFEINVTTNLSIFPRNETTVENPPEPNFFTSTKFVIIIVVSVCVLIGTTFLLVVFIKKRKR